MRLSVEHWKLTKLFKKVISEVVVLKCLISAVLGFGLLLGVDALWAKEGACIKVDGSVKFGCGRDTEVVAAAKSQKIQDCRWRTMIFVRTSRVGFGQCDGNGGRVLRVLCY